MADKIIASNPPRDGRQWDNHCARCGSSVRWEECYNCGGEGVSGHDCGEDCCCCDDPEENVTCDICRGEGGWWRCLSSPEWCESHPMLGRDKVERGSIEWYTLDEAKAK